MVDNKKVYEVVHLPPDDAAVIVRNTAGVGGKSCYAAARQRFLSTSEMSFTFTLIIMD
jgi:hypothetical protein